VQAFCFIFDTLSVLFLRLAEPILFFSFFTERCFSFSLVTLLLSVKLIHLASISFFISLPCLLYGFVSIFALPLVSIMGTLAIILRLLGLLFLSSPILLGLVDIFLVVSLRSASVSFELIVILILEILKLESSSQPVFLIFLLFLLLIVLFPLFFALLVLLLLLALMLAVSLSLLFFFAELGSFVFTLLLEFVTSNLVGMLFFLTEKFIVLLLLLSFLLQLSDIFFLSFLSLLFFSLLKLFLVLHMLLLLLFVLLPFEVSPPLGF